MRRLLGGRSVVSSRQAVTPPRPDLFRLVRHLELAGPGFAPGMPVMGERVVTIMGKADPSVDDTLYLFYPETDTARACGVDHLRKIAATTPAGAPQVSDAAALGQLEAIMAALGAPWETVVARLHTITQPVLYANGSHDVMIDAYASYAAAQELPNAKLVLYSDAGTRSVRISTTSPGVRPSSRLTVGVGRTFRPTRPLSVCQAGRPMLFNVHHIDRGPRAPGWARRLTSALVAGGPQNRTPHFIDHPIDN